MSEQQTVLRNSAVMAAGTLVSRLSGFVRSALLAAALGASIRADVFTIANTIPNMLYILLAGGVVNAVLVPQLVRSMKNDPDRGEAYTSRVITLVCVFLALVTVLLVIGAPLLLRLLITRTMPPEGFDSAVLLARLCLPQVFFYGMFVLVGQVLNARHRFGPMMWAPIANNVIAVATLVVYLLVFGPDNPFQAGFSHDRALLLGLGSTAGIAVQLLVLLPYLRAAGVSLRPRFDFRDAGLGHTLRLGVWTILFVVVNQIAYFVVVRLASTGTAGADQAGTGYAVYSSTFIVIMVPHAIVTVSLATAILPRLSAYAESREPGRLAGTLAPVLRTALAVMIPFAALLPALAAPMAQVLWGYGAAAPYVSNYVDTLVLFGPGLIFFTVHFLLLRGFYAREENRTVFVIQCAVAATNIVVALVLVRSASAQHTTPALVVAYTASYLVGSLVSYVVLSRRLGGLRTRTLLRFLVRLVIAATLAGLAAFVVRVIAPDATTAANTPEALLIGAVIGVVGLAVLLGAARLMRISEVTEVTGLLTRRLSRR